MNIKKIYKILLSKINPVKYAQKVGVNFEKDELHIYGRVAWGSEPWIITVGKNVYITDGVKFITHDGGGLIFRKYVPDLEITKPITIGDDVYIGNNVIVLPGVHIGNRVVIGAGAVVTRDVPDNSVMVGVPARRIKSADEYFEKICANSLHLGHLSGREKDKKLMEYYGYSGNSKGIYF